MSNKIRYTKFFQILGLDYGDTSNLDKQYRKMALENHPDRGGDMEMMQRINNAKKAIDSAIKSGIKFPKENKQKKFNKSNNRNKEKNKLYDKNSPFEKMDRKIKVKQSPQYNEPKYTSEEMLEMYRIKEESVNIFLNHIKKNIEKKIKIKYVFDSKKIDQYFITLNEVISFKEYPSYKIFIECLICKLDNLIDINISEYRNGIKSELFTGDYDINDFKIFEEKFTDQNINLDFVI